MTYSLARESSSHEHRNLRAFCVIDLNGNATTYAKSRHFNKKRSKQKIINLGSPIQKVVHGSEMFGLIAEDGTFKVIKPNGREIKKARPKKSSERVVGAAMTTAAYVYLQSDGFAYSGGRDISGGKLDKSGETNDGYNMSELMGGSVVDLVSTDNAFVAILDDFFVGVPGLRGGRKGDNSNLWGWPKDSWGGDVLDIQGFFDQLWTNRFAVVGRRTDGTVEAWGHKAFGGHLDQDEEDALNQGRIVDVVATSTAFAAITQDGPVMAWGDRGNGGDIQGKNDLYSKDVDELIASDSAFLALKKDGSLVAWGNASTGGKIPRKFRDQLTGIEHIHASNYGFVAITDDQAFSWGSPYIHKKKINLPEDHTVEKVVASSEAFAILTTQGAVLTWGKDDVGGRPMEEIRSDLRSGIKDIASTYGSMAAITESGDILAWGDSDFGGKTERFTPAVPASHFG